MALKLPVYNLKNLDQKVSEVECDESIFAKEFNMALVHQLIKVYNANAHTGSKSTLNRSDVRGGGRKPRRQKGTGRARIGTIRSPIMRGGGMTFAFNAQEMLGKKTMHKKMYRGALLSLISEQIRRGAIKVVDDMVLSNHKTKDFVKMMASNKLEKAYLIVDQPEDNLLLATRNLYHFQIGMVNQIDVMKLYSSDCILMDLSSLKLLEKRYES